MQRKNERDHITENAMPNPTTIASETSVLLEGLIVLVGVLCCTNVIHGEFVFDDKFAIVSNADVRSSSPWYDMFLHDFWGMPIRNILSNKSYRPLVTLTFRANYFFSELRPFAYHATNIMLHGVATLLFVQCAKGLLKDNITTAYGAGLLFAVHPAHTEAICNVVGRAELMSFIFTLTALNVIVGDKSARLSVASRAFVVLCGVCAYLSKETGLLVFPLCTWYVVCFRFRSWSQCLGCTLPWVGAFFSFLFVRAYLLGFEVSPNFTPVDNPLYFEKNRTKRALGITQVHMEYTRLLFYPQTLSCDYGPSSLPPCESLDSRMGINPCAATALMMYFVYLFAGLYSYMKYREGKRAFLFAFVWFMVSVYPLSHLGLNIGTLVAERLLYTPSAPFLLWCASLASTHLARVGRNMKSLFYGLFMILAFWWAYRSMERSKDWVDAKVLFESSLAVFPKNSRMNNNLGTMLLRDSVRAGVEKRSILASALFHFETATKYSPTHAMAWHNRGLVHLMQGNTKHSLEFFERALLLEPRATLILNNYGIALERMNRKEEAKKIFGQVEQILHHGVEPRNRPGFS